MPNNITNLEDICKILSTNIENNTWAVVTNYNYVVVISDKLGLAVVTIGDVLAAKKGAMELSREVAKIGILVQAYPFVVATPTPEDSDIFLRPDHITEDITAALKKRVGEKAVMSFEDAETLLAHLWDGVQMVEQAPLVRTADTKPVIQEIKKVDIKPLSPEFKKMLVACADRALGSNKPWVAGVEITVEQLVAEDFMLGPLLLVASENWTPPYLKSKKQGGFIFSIAHDPDKAIIGYRVTGIHMASPLIVMTSVAATIRRRSRKGACILDPCLLRFANFIDEIKGIEQTTNNADTMMVASKE